MVTDTQTGNSWTCDFTNSCQPVPPKLAIGNHFRAGLTALSFTPFFARVRSFVGLLPSPIGCAGPVAPDTAIAALAYQTGRDCRRTPTSLQPRPTILFGGAPESSQCEKKVTSYAVQIPSLLFFPASAAVPTGFLVGFLLTGESNVKGVRMPEYRFCNLEASRFGGRPAGRWSCL